MTLAIFCIMINKGLFFQGFIMKKIVLCSVVCSLFFLSACDTHPSRRRVVRGPRVVAGPGLHRGRHFGRGGVRRVRGGRVRRW